MLTRRHIRVKVMQSLYAMTQSQSDHLDKELKFLNYSMEQMYDLLLIMLQLLVAIRDLAEDQLHKSRHKHLATQEDKNPNTKFIQNEVLQLLASNEVLQERIRKRKLNVWELDSEYVALIWKSIRDDESYADYMKVSEKTFAADRSFIVQIFKEIIAPDDKLYEYIEDKRLTWIDDLPLVNTALVKMIKKLKPNATAFLPALYKDEEDKDFALRLFRKAFASSETYTAAIDGKTPNWDKDRIAELDKIMISMAICEFLEFPSIPVKVTINEYLEIAKEYSTPKSSIFINGILDKISKEYYASDKIQKIGRGLL